MKKNKLKERNEKFESKSVFLGVATGLVTGAVNGVFGGGGGMILVPALVKLFKKKTKRAHATAIMLILPMSVVSGIFYASFGDFQLKIGLPVAGGVILGGAVGALLLKKISPKWVGIIFSFVMLAAGIKMLFF